MGSGKKYATYSDFGQSLYNGNFPLNLDSDTTAGEPAENGRKGLVITKNGVFANRDRNLTSAGTLGLVYCGDLGDNYEITMDLTPHHISPNDRWNSIVFKFWTGSAIGKDADAGNWFVNWNGGFKDCKLGANKSGTAMGAAESLSDENRTDKVEAGKPITLKLSRSVSNGRASVRLEYKMGQASYKTLLSIAGAVSEEGGNAGLKIFNLVIQHEFAENGSFELGKIVKTKK